MDNVLGMFLAMFGLAYGAVASLFEGIILSLLITGVASPQWAVPAAVVGGVAIYCIRRFMVGCVAWAGEMVGIAPPFPGWTHMWRLDMFFLLLPGLLGLGAGFLGSWLIG